MKTTQRVLVVLAAALVMLSGTGCNKLKARDHLNKGVQAYKNSKFEQAIDHFQQAVALDPSLINARLYLATAFAQQYIPGADTPENNHYAEQAIDQYKQVLQVDPRNINSIKGIAYLYLQMKKFGDVFELVVGQADEGRHAFFGAAILQERDQMLAVVVAEHHVRHR